jgi:hypothetical protein
MTLWAGLAHYIYPPSLPQREKSEIVNLENKPRELPQCHYRITLPSDTLSVLITHALAAAWVHLRDTETDWFHSKNQYAGSTHNASQEAVNG